MIPKRFHVHMYYNANWLAMVCVVNFCDVESAMHYDAATPDDFQMAYAERCAQRILRYMGAA